MSRLFRSPDVIWDQVDASTVLCDTASAAYYDLNATGALVWNAAGGATVDEVVAVVARAHADVSESLIRRDVVALVDALLAARLLLAQPGAALAA